ALDHAGVVEFPEVVDHRLRTHAECIADLGHVTRPLGEQSEDTSPVFVAEEIEQRRGIHLPVVRVQHIYCCRSWGRGVVADSPAGAGNTSSGSEGYHGPP